MRSDGAPGLHCGARIGELTHLRAEDVRDEAGVPVMDLTKTKTGKARTVPIHYHLLAQGFLTFVASVGNGTLFYDAKRHRAGMKASPGELRAQKVAAWVRKVVGLDAAVDPNHGWRHTWKTRALEAGIEERLRDAITGHSVGSVARGYERPTVTMLAKAMERFPRYVT